MDVLTKGPNAVIHDMSEIAAVGHRVVHGGEYFQKSALIDEDVIAKIDELAELAPLHNKAALAGIYACRKLMPDTPGWLRCSILRFSKHCHLLLICILFPMTSCEKYGYVNMAPHGTSHRYIAERAADMLDEPLTDLRLITCPSEAMVAQFLRLIMVFLLIPQWALRRLMA